MSIKDTLPDMSGCDDYDAQQYTAAIIYRIGDAMWDYSPPSTVDREPYRRAVAAEALALTRQWRKTLPPSKRMCDNLDDNPRRLLRSAIHNIISVDRYLEDGHHEQAAHTLRAAEANLRTWLKVQQG